MPRVPWSRDQLIQALALYCQIPFGKMHARNPVVVALAARIERTPSAVALKLVNFASLDPDLRNRDVVGMGNTSVADRLVWEEYYGRWEAIVSDSNVDTESVERSPGGATPTAPGGPTEVEREVTIRRGQSFFRGAVLAAYDSACCITGITCGRLLRASHIVPWSHDPSLRLDPRNGLCLNGLHDAAFDRGLITLSDRLELRVSKIVRDEVPTPIYNEMFERHAGLPIRLPERFWPAPEMLDFHRRNIFVA